MKRHVLIVELAGPAGVGKTTLWKALSQSDPTIQFCPIPAVRDPRNLPFFLMNLARMLPVFLALLREQKQKWLTPDFMVRMAILNGWARQLRAVPASGRGILVLDHGPVYMLAELLRHGPNGFRRIAPVWWQSVCADWADTLDMIICLDAPDAVLVERSRSRQKGHGIKQHADDWAAEFLARSRAAQAEVLSSMLAQPHKMKVVEIDTSRSSVPELAATISCLFAEENQTK